MAWFVLRAETTTPSYNTVAWTPAVTPCERRKRETTGLTLFKVSSDMRNILLWKVEYCARLKFSPERRLMEFAR